MKRKIAAKSGTTKNNIKYKLLTIRRELDDEIMKTRMSIYYRIDDYIEANGCLTNY